ncbi:MAG: peptidase M23, partial [Clostridium sp.]
MKKKYAVLFVSGALLISNAGLLKAESFEGRESEMNAKCAVIKDTKTQEECSRYKSYLQSKSDNLDKEIRDIKSQIASVKG